MRRLLYTYVHVSLEFLDCTVLPLACRMNALCALPKYGFLFDMRCEKLVRYTVICKWQKLQFTIKIDGKCL